ADEGILLCRRTRAVDDRLHLNAHLREVLEHEILERVVAEHGRKGHVGSGRSEVRGDDGSATHEILPAVEAHAWRWRLRHAADHGGVREAVDDGVADDVRGDAAELMEEGTQRREIDALGMHQHEKLVDRKVRWTGLDEG